ncbi:hypothetical protein ACLOJK_004495 [Asimina triloba]
MATLLTAYSSSSQIIPCSTPSATLAFLRRSWASNRWNPFQKLLSFASNPSACKRAAARCGSTGNGVITTSSNARGTLHLLQEFGLTEAESVALFQNNPSLAYVSQELLNIRLNSLLSLGISHFAICRLITKCPDIITASAVGQFLDFVQENLEGIRPGKLERLLIKTEPRFLVGFDKKVELLLEYGIPNEKLVHVVNGVNLKDFCCKEIEKTEKIIIFLNQLSSNLVIRRPMLLNLDLDDQLIPRADFLSKLSGEDDCTSILVQKFPTILSYTVEHLEMHVEFFRSIGLSQEEILRIIVVYPNVFSASRERKLQPRIEFLKQCGLNKNDIFRFLIKAPLFLTLSFEENLSKKLGFLVKLGYKYRTRELVMAMGATTRTSCENMQLVIDIFLDYGLSCEDIFIMSKKHPQVLQYNHKSLEKKMLYLVQGIGRDVGELLSFPAFLGYKLDERIKPRYEEKIEVRGKGMSINKLLSVSSERFFKKKRRETGTELDEVKMG